MIEKANTIERIGGLDEGLLRQIVEMENKLFPERLRTSEEKIKATFEMPGTVNIIAYCDKGKVAGYISSVLHNDALSWLKDLDPELEDMPGALYLDSIAIRHDLQGKGYFSKLLNAFLKYTEGRPVTMHARIINNCSLGMQKHGARFVRNVDDWCGSGEPFDFLILFPNKE